MKVYERKRKKTKSKKRRKAKSTTSQSKMERLRHSKAWARWRAAVYRRDDYTCQLCHATKVYIEPHHILMKAKYPELVFNIDNGVTLCWKCHRYETDLHNGNQQMIKKLQRVVAQNKKKHPEVYVRRSTTIPRRKRIRR